MIRIIFAAMLALVLTGCQTTNIDTSIQQTLPKVCVAARTAHAAFLTAAAFTAVSANTIRKEAAAWDSLEPLCINPETKTSAEVLVTATLALATISKALREAQ